MSPLRISNTTKDNNFKPSPANKKVFIQKRLSQTNKNLFTSVKGMSRCTSPVGGGQAAGSMTVEAALVLPVFLFFFLHLSGVTEMLRLHGKMTAALWNTGNQIALYGETVSDVVEELPDWSISYFFVDKQVTAFLGEEYLDNSPLVYGTEGLNYLRSDYRDEDECVDIIVTYQVEPPISIFPFGYRRMGSRYYARCWTGYDVTAPDKVCKYVYITAHGDVWHETPDCSYIYHETNSVPIKRIKEMKNAIGKEYTLCELCGDNPQGKQVYVTSEGEKYHIVRNCSAIYKDVRAVEWDEGLPYRPCSRCGLRD